MRNAYNTSAYGSFAYVYDIFMDKIHELDTLYEGQHVKVNMTFGLVCESDKDVRTLLKEADEKLYIGKTNGRNQVVS